MYYPFVRKAFQLDPERAHEVTNITPRHRTLLEMLVRQKYRNPLPAWG